MAPDGPARSARGADLSLRLDRHRPVQRRARSDRRRRVVDARRERRDGDDQARRARRLDLRVLRRLGAELHVLHRAHAQLDRPLLRSAELRPGSRTTVTPGATTTSREWFRPNPPLPSIKWGPRNNTNIQESAMLFALNHVAKNKELYLENYWLKNKRAVDKGKTGPTYAWVIPADAAPQGRRRRRGQRAATPGPRVRTRRRRRSRPATSTSTAGDYIVRGDQPYPHAGRHVLLAAELSRRRIRRRTTTPAGRSSSCATSRSCRSPTRAILDAADDDGDGAMRRRRAASRARGSVLVVEHTGDNKLVTFRFKNADVKMLAAEEDFELGGHKFRAGAIIIAERRSREARADRSRSSACRRGRWPRRRR